MGCCVCLLPGRGSLCCCCGLEGVDSHADVAPGGSGTTLAFDVLAVMMPRVHEATGG